MCKTWSGRSDLIDELPGAMFAWTEQDGLEALAAAHGLFNALESGIMSAGESALALPRFPYQDRLDRDRTELWFFFSTSRTRLCRLLHGVVDCIDGRVQSKPIERPFHTLLQWHSLLPCHVSICPPCRARTKTTLAPISQPHNP